MKLPWRKPKRWRVWYGREDGHYRTVTLTAKDEAAALEIADRRLREQYGDLIRDDAYGIGARELIERRPDLDQANYEFVRAERIG